jgi:hypothetical protein
VSCCRVGWGVPGLDEKKMIRLRIAELSVNPTYTDRLECVAVVWGVPGLDEGVNELLVLVARTKPKQYVINVYRA